MNRTMHSNHHPIVLTSLSFLLAIATRLGADGGTEPTDSTEKVHQFEGAIKQVNAAEKLVTVKNFWSSRTFALGEGCRVELEDQPSGGLADLQPGHRVEVSYVSHEGVRIAREIQQENLRYTGHIAALDATNRTLRVKSGLLDRVFTLAPDCEVIFRDGKPRTFAELKIGHRVTVKYLTPGDVKLARTIEQRSLEFTGGIEALDSRTDTVKAGGLMSSRTFRLADNCQIVVRGGTGGALKDLRIGDRVVFHYEEVDGVLIANRLELAADSEEPAVEKLSSRQTQRP